MSELWFKTKKYGYGWQPSTWQGWLVLTTYVLLVGLGALGLINFGAGKPSTLIAFLTFEAAVTAGLIIICRAKGGPARWRWGDDN